MGPGESDSRRFPQTKRETQAPQSRPASQPQIKAHQQREVIQLPWPSGVELNLKRRVEFAEGHERLTIVQRKGLCDQRRFQIAGACRVRKRRQWGAHTAGSCCGRFRFFPGG